MKTRDTPAGVNAQASVIARAQRLEPEAFEELVDTYSARLYGFLYRLTGRRDDAEELAQEVFVRLVRMIGRYRDDGRFEAWLFRIAANLARDLIRRDRRAPPMQPLEAPSGFGGVAAPSWKRAADLSEPPPEERLRLAEDVDALQRALAKLPAAEREVIMLRNYTNMSFAEIAEAMAIPLGTALARSHRGLAKLRRWMESSS